MCFDVLLWCVCVCVCVCVQGWTLTFWLTRHLSGKWKKIPDKKKITRQKYEGRSHGPPALSFNFNLSYQYLFLLVIHYRERADDPGWKPSELRLIQRQLSSRCDSSANTDSREKTFQSKLRQEGPLCQILLIEMGRMLTKMVRQIKSGWSCIE